MKARLFSQTFGTAATKYFELPGFIFEERDDDKLYNNTISFLLCASGYKKHLNELLTLNIKVDKK